MTPRALLLPLGRGLATGVELPHPGSGRFFQFGGRDRTPIPIAAGASWSRVLDPLAEARGDKASAHFPFAEVRGDRASASSKEL